MTQYLKQEEEYTRLLQSCAELTEKYDHMWSRAYGNAHDPGATPAANGMPVSRQFSNPSLARNRREEDNENCLGSSSIDRLGTRGGTSANAPSPQQRVGGHIGLPRPQTQNTFNRRNMISYGGISGGTVSRGVGVSRGGLSRQNSNEHTMTMLTQQHVSEEDDASEDASLGLGNLKVFAKYATSGRKLKIMGDPTPTLTLDRPKRYY